MNAIATIEKNINPKIHPELRPGSTVRVHVKVRESILKEEQKAKTAKAKKDKDQGAHLPPQHPPRRWARGAPG